MNNNFSSLLIALLLFVIGVPVASDLDLISLQTSRVLAHPVCLLLASGASVVPVACIPLACLWRSPDRFKYSLRRS